MLTFVLMTPEGEKADAAVGDGPVDASLKAVERGWFANQLKRLPNPRYYSR